jgi:hypothetical protein
MPIIKVHYHDHAGTCRKCGDAREKLDQIKHLSGSSDEIMKLYDNSCGVGQEILMAFWMSYGQSEDE